MYVDLEAAAKAVVDELIAGGVRGVVDARDINPPCVQVRAPRINFRFGKGIELEWEAFAIVPDNGSSLTTYKALGDLVNQVQEALDGRVQTGSPETARLTHGPEVPIYRLSWTERINHR